MGGRTASLKEPIPLFWWSETRLMQKKKENYGDLLSKYLVEKISGRPVKWVQPKKQPWYRLNKRNYLAVGSIIHHASKESVVWGSGIIDRTQKIEPAEFLAVRGPQTRKFLQNLGYHCPEVYGDPALLLPKYFSPQVEKKFEFGIIPHYHDYQQVYQWYQNDQEILVIDLMTTDVEEVTKQILSCRKTISSSLHGLIVSHAYDIPSKWVKFSNKLFGDGIKFIDYFESVHLFLYEPVFLYEKLIPEKLELVLGDTFHLPPKVNILRVQKNLTTHCPFL